MIVTPISYDFKIPATLLVPFADGAERTLFLGLLTPLAQRVY